MKEKLEQVKQQFTELQDYITSSINQCESQAFYHDEWTYDVNDAASAKAKKPEGGGCSRVLEGGDVFEKAGVNFSSLKGHSLPKAATEKRPELIDCEFYATGVSIVIHPNNPFIPTSHANVRFFIAETPKGSVWWFGGGFDLTPYYPFTEDCIAWHQQAKQTCDAYDVSLYPKFKKRCDDYFYLKHRDEHRGIGGLFYDDFNELGFDKTLAMSESVGKTFIDAYMGIVSKRQHTPFTQAQRDFQCYRRGRYVEFNLVYDRGTIFGLQSNGRTESILMSLPPVVNWHYDKQFADDSAEKKLTDYYLKPQDWADLS